MERTVTDFMAEVERLARETGLKLAPNTKLYDIKSGKAVEIIGQFDEVEGKYDLATQQK
jgi:hypothetical protein